MTTGWRCLLGLLVATPAAAESSFTARSGERSLEIDLATLPAIAVTVRDPTDGGREKTLVGPRLDEVLARLPPPAGADTLAVRCDDGWLSLLPLATVRRHPGAILALAERHRGGDRPLPPPRGPRFLVWPNLVAGKLVADPALTSNGWAFGASIVEYVVGADFALAAPAGASAAASEGAGLFVRHCQPCHEVGGRGGRAGWDLSVPNVLTYRTEGYVKSYILEPRRKNTVGHMPAFRGKLGAPEVAALVAYLRSLAPSDR